MAYCFTNIITTLPYGYQLKYEFITTKAGLTSGTKSVNNGAYILDLGKIAAEIDQAGLEWKPNAVTLKLCNTGNAATPNAAPNGEFSTNVFATGSGATTAVELRIWISYNAGVAWENLFVGFCDLEIKTQADIDLGMSVNREFSVTAADILLSLKTVAVDFASNPPTTFTAAASLPIAYTLEDGTPKIATVSAGIASPKFVLLGDLLLNIAQRLPFTADAGFLPSIVVNYASCQHKFKNKTTANEYGLDGVCLYYDLAPAEIGYTGSNLRVASFFQSTAGDGTAMDAKNYDVMLKRVCNSLLVVPIGRLTGTAGAYTYTLYFTHRAFAGMDQIADGALGTPLSQFANSYRPLFSIKVNNGPWPYSWESIDFGGGRDLNIRNLFFTTPVNAGLTDPSVWIYLWAQDANNKIGTVEAASIGQLFGKKTSNSVEHIHDAKILTSQGYFYAATATAGYYALAGSIYDIVLTGSFTSWSTATEAFENSYCTLAVAGVAWSLRPFVKYKITRTNDAGSPYTNVISSIERDLARNEVKVKLVGWVQA